MSPLFTVDILSEDAILKWYKESHSQRGWSVFMDQMKKFIEWLEQAEEGKDSQDTPHVEVFDNSLRRRKFQHERVHFFIGMASAKMPKSA